MKCLDEIHNVEKGVRATRKDVLAQIERVLADVSAWRALGIKIKSRDLKALEKARRKPGALCRQRTTPAGVATNRVAIDGRRV